MAPGWRLRQGSEAREGTSNGGQRSTADADGTAAAAPETTTRTETGNPDAPLSNRTHDHHDLDVYLDGDDGAPESLDFQTIYNAAFELRRSSLDPGRRAAFEPVESLDFSASAAAVSAASAGAAGGAGAGAGAQASAGDGGGSPAAALVVVGSGGDTSAELKLRGKPFLGYAGRDERGEKKRRMKKIYKRGSLAVVLTCKKKHFLSLPPPRTHTHTLRIKPHTLFKLAATAAIGLGTGCLAASLGAAVDRGLRFKNETVHAIVRRHGFSPGGVALAALFAASWAALLTSLSAFLVATLAPVSGGSGVSLVRERERERERERKRESGESFFFFFFL